MEAILVAISAVEAATVCALLVGLQRRDRKMREQFNAALSFALRHNMIEGRRFIRAFRDNDYALLNSAFPEWSRYQAEAYEMELC